MSHPSTVTFMHIRAVYVQRCSAKLKRCRHVHPPMSSIRMLERHMFSLHAKSRHACLFRFLVCRKFQHVRADANEDRGEEFAALWTWHGKGYLFRRGGIMPPSSSFAKLVVGPEEAPACMAPLS